MSSTTLRPITEAEYAAWLDESVPAYAADKVASGAWPAVAAVDRSRREFHALLPEGRQTPDHYVYAIVDAAGVPVGTLWFATEDRGGARIAYVYDVKVAPAHRRHGHARRAFALLEDEVRGAGLAGIGLHVFGHNTAAQALYAALGYRPTSISLFKPLGDPAGGG
jgi:ribosomal protein S18 acetylase RimI-like enzyme